MSSHNTNIPESPVHGDTGQPGPSLETLLRRLVDTPPDFLEEPRIWRSGQVVVAAVVNDLLAMHAVHADDQALGRFASNDAQADRNRLALALLACWLLADDALVSRSLPQARLLDVLDTLVGELAGSAAAHDYVHDPDRREEFVRSTLARLGLRPAGETEAQAQDRLSALSGVERERLIRASRDAERRAREIREALVRKAAEESADKWTRE